MRSRHVLAYLAVMLAAASSVFAQERDNLIDITRGLDSTATMEQEQAITEIAKHMESEPEHVSLILANQWGKRLLRLKKYDKLANWTLQATCVPADPPLSMPAMEALQEMRVRALLAAGRSEDALAAAKSYFNFCRMKQTSAALQLLVKSLSADPKTAPLVDKLAEEEHNGAQPVDEASKAVTSNVLHSIAVDAAPYMPWIEREDGKDFRSLIRRGNRLLLADKPAEAREAFEMAKEMAADSQMPAVVESIARAIRAEDGTIGRANSYLLANYPTTAKTSADK